MAERFMVVLNIVNLKIKTIKQSGENSDKQGKKLKRILIIISSTVLYLHQQECSFLKSKCHSLNPNPHCLWIKRLFVLKTEISPSWRSKIFV
jgi:hypothetical protein